MDEAGKDRTIEVALKHFGNAAAVALTILVSMNLAWGLMASSVLMTPTPRGIHWTCMTAGALAGLLSGLRLAVATNNGITGVFTAIIIGTLAAVGFGALAGGLAPRIYNAYTFYGSHSPWQPVQYRIPNQGLSSSRGGPDVHIDPYNAGEVDIAIDNYDHSRLQAAFRRGTMNDFCLTALEQHAGGVIRARWPKGRAGKYPRILPCELARATNVFPQQRARN